MNKRDFILIGIWIVHILLVVFTPLSPWTLIVTVLLIFVIIFYGNQIIDSLKGFSLSISALQNKLEKKRDEQREVLRRIRKK